jgi:hypothetical protein
MTPLHATFGDALLRAHRALAEDLRGLESARTTAGGSPAALAARLERTRGDLAEHFRFEEDNGYLRGVLERNPHLDRAILHLGQEHRKLLQSLDDLRAEVGAAAVVTDELWNKVAGWVRRVRRHERSENILVEDAYNLDLSAED